MEINVAKAKVVRITDSKKMNLENCRGMYKLKSTDIWEYTKRGLKVQREN